MLWLDLEGAVNARDVGGIPTDDGGKITRGRLLRSDNLQDLSPTDVTYLVDHLGLSTVVDLRSPTEVASEGPAPLTRHLRIRREREHTVLEFHGEIDIAAAAQITPYLDRATTRPGARVVIDLSGVAFFDCSGLRLLYRARSRVLSRVRN